MIRLKASINGKPVMDMTLLHLLETRLIHLLKAGDKIEFIVEDDVIPVKQVFTETRQLKSTTKGVQT